MVLNRQFRANRIQLVRIFRPAWIRIIHQTDCERQTKRPPDQRILAATAIATADRSSPVRQEYQRQSSHHSKARAAIGQDVFAIGFENERMHAPTGPQEIVTETRIDHSPSDQHHTGSKVLQL